MAVIGYARVAPLIRTPSFNSTLSTPPLPLESSPTTESAAQRPTVLSSPPVWTTSEKGMFSRFGN